MAVLRLSRLYCYFNPHLVVILSRGKLNLMRKTTKNNNLLKKKQKLKLLFIIVAVIMKKAF